MSRVLSLVKNTANGAGLAAALEAAPQAKVYAQPEAAMKLLREWQRMQGRPLSVQASVFMSVCGAVAVRAYLTGRIRISFGCPDAREHASIGRDRLVAGLPVREVHELARSLRAAKAATAPPAPPVAIAQNMTEAGAL